MTMPTVTLPEIDHTRRPIRQVDPVANLRVVMVEPTLVVKNFQADLDMAGRSVAALRLLNAKWMRTSIGVSDYLFCAWTLALRFAELGVAPVWRGGPTYWNDKGWPDRPLRSDPEEQWRPSRGTTRQNLLRWIDLQWLREVLGTGHARKVPYRAWRDVFAPDDEAARVAWAKVNRLHWSSGQLATTPAFEVLDQLGIPDDVRVGLTGLVDSNTAERRNVASRRRDAFKERTIAENVQLPRPLGAEEMARRVEYFEAVELARGQPALTAKIMGWISGEPVSRQTALEMRRKLSDQYGLDRQAWLGVRRKGRSSASGGPSGRAR